MEEILIYKVQDRRVLYDSNLVSYKDHRVRSQAWDEIGVELGLTASECREMWCKLRNCYNNARKRRLRLRNGQLPMIGKWKYEDEMNFLIPYMSTNCEGSDWATQSYREPQSPVPGDEINYTIDETIVETPENDEELNFEEVDLTATHCSVVLDNSETLPNVSSASSLMSNKIAPMNQTSSIGKLMVQVKPMGKEGNTSAPSSLPEAISPRETIVVEDELSQDKSVRDCEEINNEVPPGSSVDTETCSTASSKVTVELNEQSRNKSVLTIVIKSPNSGSGRYQDQTSEDATEEEYYLRLAKMAKKLKPPDRIKLREKVSRVVMNELINVLPEEVTK